MIRDIAVHPTRTWHSLTLDKPRERADISMARSML
jgi:hypothetical protein